MDPRTEQLERWEGDLEAFLNAFESTNVDPDVVERLWSKCTEDFAAFRASNDAMSGQGQSLPDALREKAQAVLRLTAIAEAIAEAIAGRSRAELSSEMERIGAARGRLRDVRARGTSGSVGTTGGSCDIRG